MSDQFENIPDELTQRDQWLYWNASADKPRQPLSSPAADFGCSWSDPDEWMPFDDVVDGAGMVENAGIGYVNAADNDDYARGLYGVIDLDGVIDEDGRPKEWLPSLQPFFDRDAYMEFSPSGEGIHIPIAGLDAPEWWADQHFSAEEHEGVEVLTNKFSTFTGDTLKNCGEEVVDYGDWLDDWLLEAYQEITGEDPLADQAGEIDPDDAPDTSSAGQPGDRDEWMTADIAEDALDHIDPDVSYTTWRDVGMGLVNHFGTTTGGSLFEQWSRSGRKWDSDAEQQVKRIISDAGGYNYGIGSVIKHAKSGGWDASAAARDAMGGRPKQTPDEDGDRDEQDGDGNRDGDGDRGGDGDGPDAEDDIYSPIERFDYGLRIWKETKDGEWYSEQLTNFWIDVDAILERDDGSVEYLLTIDPVAESEYQVAVEPVVFNDKRQFEAKVCGEGLSATYDGSTPELNRLKEYVAQQDAPVRRGTEHIGLHGDEWVVPDGALTADGWTDDPENVFESANTPLSNKCSLTPELGDDYDVGEVREIVELVPKMRLTERFLPALGWFYAAPTRPYVQQWEGEFNILAVTGDSGAGKTATLETLWELFGVGGDLLRADGTSFPKMRALATSNALPVIFDEYKPADMSSYVVDDFHSLLRTSTRGGIEEKGRPDGSVVGHELLAPAVISGEQALRGTAEERRTLQTNFSRQASVGGTPESEAFTKLTGGELNGEFLEGHDLKQHALAYYQWLLQQGESQLKHYWRSARDRTAATVDELGISDLDDMRFQAIQTLVYGCRLYREFASDVGVDDAPIGDREVERAMRYILNERTSTEHVSNLDRLLELAGRAAAAGYLERGEHFEITHENEPDEELRIKLSLVYDQLRRYARDHDIQDADLLDSGGDYRSRINEAAEDGDSYVVATSKQTPGLNRCVAIGTRRAETDVDGFEMSMFRPGDETEDEQDDADDEMAPGFKLSELDPSRGQPVTFQATVTSNLDPKPWLQAEGILQNDSGVARFIARGSSNPVDDVEEGDRVEVRDAMVTENDDGAPVVELIDGLTTIVSAATPSQQSGLDEAATTDGGEEPPTRSSVPLPPEDATGPGANARRLKAILEENASSLSKSDLFGRAANRFGISPDDAEAALERGRQEGLLTDAGGDTIKSV